MYTVKYYMHNLVSFSVIFPYYKIIMLITSLSFLIYLLVSNYVHGINFFIVFITLISIAKSIHIIIYNITIQIGRKSH